MLANIILETFIKGGPIMWPLLIVSIIAFGSVIERSAWWLSESRKREDDKLDKVYSALSDGDYETASRMAEGSGDPRLRVIYRGLHHAQSSLFGAMQVQAGVELQRSGRFQSVMDTAITLAPLLGLLGTVTGIMHSFNFVGNEELAAAKVSGGIAEALIATAGGLGVAIFTLVPFNYFSGRISRLQFELENAMTNTEVLVDSAKKKGYDTQIWRKGE